MYAKLQDYFEDKVSRILAEKMAALEKTEALEKTIVERDELISEEQC